MPQGSEVQVQVHNWGPFCSPRGSEVQVSHKTSKKGFKNIQRSIATYQILNLVGLSKFKGGNVPSAPSLIKNTPSQSPKNRAFSISAYTVEIRRSAQCQGCGIIFIFHCKKEGKPIPALQKISL